MTASIATVLHAGPVPGLIRMAPERAALIARESERALDLCAFAARDNAWVLRRELGLSG